MKASIQVSDVFCFGGFLPSGVTHTMLASRYTSVVIVFVITRASNNAATSYLMRFFV